MWQIEQGRIPLMVAVERGKYPAYSLRLVEDLRASGVFTRVEHLADFPEADLVISLNRGIDDGMLYVIPLFTIISFGLVPTWGRVEHGHSFSVRPGPQVLSKSECSAEAVLVDFTFEGASTLGWAASLVNISTNYTVRDVRETDRYRNGLALAVTQNAEAIKRMVTPLTCESV